MIGLAEIGPNDLLFFIHGKGEARYTDLIKEFVKKGKCAKQTLINYKKKLEAKGIVDKKISEKTKRPVYYVPEKHQQKVKSLLTKKALDELPSSILEHFMRAYKQRIIDQMNREFDSEAQEYAAESMRHE